MAEPIVRIVVTDTFRKTVKQIGGMQRGPASPFPLPPNLNVGGGLSPLIFQIVYTFLLCLTQ